MLHPIRPTPGAHDLVADSLTLSLPGGRVLVDAISLSISDGERLAIVGPNGAGKTTLLRLMAGLLKPSSGSVQLGGLDLKGLSDHERARKIAVVTQTDAPDQRLTVAEYVGLGRLPHEGRRGQTHDRAVVASAIQRVGLAGLEARRLGTLSGGERQRSAIARALAQEPAVLFLDEPTNHLDLRARIDLLALVHGLGVTVVAVLHDLALVDGFADRVAVLHQGRLVIHADPATALAPDITRTVFAMTSFRATDPVSGRSVLVFDATP